MINLLSLLACAMFEDKKEEVDPNAIVSCETVPDVASGSYREFASNELPAGQPRALYDETLIQLEGDKTQLQNTATSKPQMCEGWGKVFFFWDNPITPEMQTAYKSLPLDVKTKIANTPMCTKDLVKGAMPVAVGFCPEQVALIFTGDSVMQEMPMCRLWNGTYYMLLQNVIF